MRYLGGLLVLILALSTVAFASTNSAEGELVSKGISAYEDDNFKMSYEVLKPVAEKGNSKAQYYVGLIHLEENSSFFDVQAAAKWISKASNNNNDSAQATMGAMYAQGYGVNMDDDKAKYWFERSAKNGNARGAYNLGLHYEMMEYDFDTAFKWYIEAAEKDYALAQFMVGEYFISGMIVKEDYSKAAQWYEKAANAGHPESNLKLALLYAKGEGVSKNEEKAFSLAKKAANSGLASGKFHLGLMYWGGRGTIQDDELAMKSLYDAGYIWAADGNNSWLKEALRMMNLINKDHTLYKRLKRESWNH